MKHRVHSSLPALLLAGLLAGSCGIPTGASEGELRYALHRIGNAVLPVPTGPEAGAPLLLADTLVFLPGSSRQQDLIVTRIEVLEMGGQRSRSVGRFAAVRSDDRLLLDSCPLGALCIASLVYAPIELRFVGDSLIQQLPPGSSLQPMVFGRVR